MFKRIFGQGSEERRPTYESKPVKRDAAASTTRTVNAIQQLGDTEELLVKRRDLLEKKIANELKRAKELSAAKNKRGALAALKKKKLYEQQLEAAENNIQRINEQQLMLENQRTTLETVTALKQAANASKSTMQELDIGKVDKVLDDINEQNDQMAQIQDAMAQPIGGAADMDDDELMLELEGLEAEALDDQLLEPMPVPSSRIQQPEAAQPAQAARANAVLPNAPTSRPVPAKPQKTAEELELEQLEAEMAL